MPDELKCICCPRDVRAIQQVCFFVMMDLQMLEDRLTGIRREIKLPENVAEIAAGATDRLWSVADLVDGC